MNAKLEGKLEDLRQVEDLMGNEAYQKIVQAEFIKRAAHHVAQCHSRSLTPAQRAEHVEAANAFTEMLTFLEERKKSLAHTISDIKAGKK